MTPPHLPDSKNSAPTANPSAEVSDWVESAKECGQPDTYAGKRGGIRFKVGERIDVSSDSCSSAISSVAILHNISDDGAAFWLKTAQEPGKKLHIRPFLPHGESPWIPAEVRHCTRGIKGFLIGVNFTSR